MWKLKMKSQKKKEKKQKCLRSIRDLGCMARGTRNMGCMARSIENMGCTRPSQPRRLGNLSRSMPKEKLKEGGSRSTKEPEPLTSLFLCSLICADQSIAAEDMIDSS
jgi:hypothetical protein